MTGRYGGSGANSSCQDFVVNSCGNLRKLDKRVNAFNSLQEVDQYLGGNKVVCLECGLDFKNLSNHIRHSHINMSVRDYKIKYNIPLSRALVGLPLLTSWKNSRKDIYKDPDKRRERDLYLEKAHKARKPYYGGGSKLRRTPKDKTAYSRGQLKAAKERHYKKYRPLFIKAIETAIEQDISLGEACVIVGAKRPSIMAHIKRHPEDKEIKGLLEKLKVRELPEGVRRMPNGKYQARCAINKKKFHLGTFACLNDAMECLNVFKLKNINIEDSHD